MSGELGFPPRRVLPDDVRARLRATVLDGIAKPRRTARAWYAAAAAVVLVATGAIVATKVLREPGDVSPPAAGMLNLDIGLATSSMDRCWAALRAAGKTDRVPAREDWVPLFTQVQGTDSVVAVAAAGKPMFCETTLTTVTVSDPDAAPAYEPGTRTGLLLHSATGLVGGIVDPAWETANLSMRKTDEPNGWSGFDLFFSPVTRQFVRFTRTDPAKAQLSAGLTGGPDAWRPSLLSAPAPLLSMVDRPASGVDRTSPAGRTLGDCLAGSSEIIPDAATYRPGVLLEADGYQVVLGRQGDFVTACTVEPDPRHQGRKIMRASSDLPGPPAQARRLSTGELGAVSAGGEPGKSRVPYAGALPVTAVTATFDFGAGTSVTADVVEGTFAVWIPEQFNPDPEAQRVQARDANGAVVFEGQVW